jgi:adenylate kinase family enzyme
MPSIHLTGASGSGTTTLGAVLAQALSLPHLDTDDFYWLPTDPPFSRKRPMPERLECLLAALDAAPHGFVLSGSCCGWGDPLRARFDHVVWLGLPAEERLDRLERRERARFGAAALAPGGAMHEPHREFMAWAARYDEGGLEVRSHARHAAWLEGCRSVQRLDGRLPLSLGVARVLAGLPRPG